MALMGTGETEREIWKREEGRENDRGGKLACESALSLKYFVLRINKNNIWIRCEAFPTFVFCVKGEMMHQLISH